MKALLIKLSLLAAGVGYVICAAGVEGTAPLPACAIGMSICLGWMLLVMIANR